MTCRKCCRPSSDNKLKTSTVTHKILNRIPVEPSVLDDSIQSALCTGDIVKVS